MNEEVFAESVVQRVDEVFTEETLAYHDGKTIPLTLEVGGPVVGEATLKYDPEEKALKAELRVDDPKVTEFFKELPPNIFGR